MALGLNESIRFCWVGDHAIFVDIATGRYFCLPSPLERSFRDLIGCSPAHDAHDKAAQTLVDQGLLIPRQSVGPMPRPTCAPSPVRDFSLCPSTHARRSTIALALWSEVSVSILYRTLSLGRIEAMLRTWRSEPPWRRSPPAAMPIYRDLALAFDTTAFVFRPADRCLPRALAFLFACRSHGLYPSLIFGVRTNPFTAHCWVQEGSVVLNDDVERVRTFTPILVL